MGIRNLKISTLLSIGCGVLLLVISALALIAVYLARDSNRTVETLYQQRLVPLEHLKSLADLYADVLFKSRQVSLGRADPGQTHDDVAKLIGSIQTHWKVLGETAKESNEIQALSEAIKVAQKANPIFDELLDDLSKKDIVQTNLVAVDVNDVVNVIGKKVIELEQVQLDHARLEFSQANDHYKFSIQAFGGVVALVMLVTAGTVWFLIRAITIPIRKAVAVAKRVATGDMSEQIPHEGGSEMAEMLKALHDMQGSLAKVVSDVRGSAENLALASEEIARGNQDLSARTENQASALEQTAASMEELNAQVQHNAENARQANHLASEASAVAVRGGAVVERVVETMKEINDSSRRIVDIISIIDGIAFQTNILALNAAVEAARAGEQGRGFAVVASEVRSLAGRSATAAKEVKSLINASLLRVEQGSVLVDAAGSTMNEVVTSIKTVSNLVEEIYSASSEQAAGVAQVEEGVSQMDQTTQQNAALVEEMAAAAGSLNQQARNLVEAVSVFRLNDQEETVWADVLTPQLTAQ